MRLGFERVPEEDHEVHFVFHDLGADLLVAAERSILSLVILSELLLQHFAGCACGIDLMMSQQIPVIFCPFEQVVFLVVVGNEGYLLIVFHGNFFTKS